MIAVIAQLAADPVIASLCSAGSALGAKIVYDKYKSPEGKKRRSQDVYVTKDTCEKCDDGKKQAIVDLRAFVIGVERTVGEVKQDLKDDISEVKKDVTELRSETRNNGAMLIKITAHLGVE